MHFCLLLLFKMPLNPNPTNNINKVEPKGEKSYEMPTYLLGMDLNIIQELFFFE